VAGRLKGTPPSRGYDHRVKPTSADEPNCADCGANPVRMSLGAVSLCDRCYDVRIAASTGWPRLLEPPPRGHGPGPRREC
jgi:hypothetical protein